jgi:hypothetical protein
LFLCAAAILIEISWQNVLIWSRRDRIGMARAAAWLEARHLFSFLWGWVCSTRHSYLLLHPPTPPTHTDRTTTAATTEALCPTKEDATNWMTVLQSARTAEPAAGKPKARRKSAADSDKDAEDEMKSRKFIEVTMKKKANDPLGLRLAGGTGPGSDPSRPHIYVTSTRTGSRSSEADLRKGDILTKIDSRKLVDVTVNEATAILSKANGKVIIGVARVKTEPLARQATHDEGEISEEDAKRKGVAVAAAAKPAAPTSPAGGEEVFGFGGSESPEPASPPPPVLSEEEEAEKKRMRAEKMAKMKAARELKKQGSMVDLMESLKIIDDLPE